MDRGCPKVSVAMNKVPTGGQIKVPTRSSCRSKTAERGGDGEGANHTPPPPGSSIEVCEGPYGHHFCLSTSRVVSGSRGAVRHYPQDRQTRCREVRVRRCSTAAGLASTTKSAASHPD